MGSHRPRRPQRVRRRVPGHSGRGPPGPLHGPVILERFRGHSLGQRRRPSLPPALVTNVTVCRESRAGLEGAVPAASKRRDCATVPRRLSSESDTVTGVPAPELRAQVTLSGDGASTAVPPEPGCRRRGRSQCRVGAASESRPSRVRVASESTGCASAARTGAGRAPASVRAAACAPRQAATARLPPNPRRRLVRRAATSPTSSPRRTRT